jgi:hypothetical protein
MTISIALLMLVSSSPNGFVPKQQVLAEFADCAVATKLQLARDILSTEEASKAEAKALKPINSLSNCTKGRDYVSARTGEIRGALAEVLLKSDPAKLQRLAEMPETPAVRISEMGANSRKFVIAYASCILWTNPKLAPALFNSAYSSEQEKTAMLAFGDAFSACIPEKVAYKLDIRDVRNHMASAAYGIVSIPLPKDSIGN